MTRSTDWKRYYKKRSIFSKLSGYLCQRSLQGVFKSLNSSEAAFTTIVELGGGNSIIYPWLRQRFPRSRILLIDKEEFAEPHFLRAAKNDQALTCLRHDLLENCPEPTRLLGDLVLSFGLVEHFSPHGTREMLERHFECCRPGGIVLVSFPCATPLYRGTRRLMELLGQWQFHDERLLPPQEVRNVMDQHGVELLSKLDIRLGLTQLILVYRKKGSEK